MDAIDDRVMKRIPGPRALSLTLPSSNSTTRSYCLMIRNDSASAIRPITASPATT
jgi:hypothetical protein